MGAGATVGTLAAIQAASEQDLRGALRELPEEVRSKLADSLSGTLGPNASPSDVAPILKVMDLFQYCSGSRQLGNIDQVQLTQIRDCSLEEAARAALMTDGCIGFSRLPRSEDVKMTWLIAASNWEPSGPPGPRHDSGYYEYKDVGFIDDIRCRYRAATRDTSQVVKFGSGSVFRLSRGQVTLSHDDLLPADPVKDVKVSDSKLAVYVYRPGFWETTPTTLEAPSEAAKEDLLALLKMRAGVQPIDLTLWCRMAEECRNNCLPIVDNTHAVVGHAPRATRPEWLSASGPGQANVPNPLLWGLTVEQWIFFLWACFRTKTWDALVEAKGEYAITMYDVKDHFVVPWSRGTGCSVALLLNHQRPKHVDLMLSHAWAGSVVETYNCLQSLVNVHGVPSSAGVFFALSQCINLKTPRRMAFPSQSNWSWNLSQKS